LVLLLLAIFELVSVIFILLVITFSNVPFTHKLTHWEEGYPAYENFCFKTPLGSRLI